MTKSVVPAEPLGSLDDVLAAMPNASASIQADAYDRALESHFGSRHAVSVSSGTAALHTALVACGVGIGDEVIVPAISVMMSVAPVIYCGARPVFVDSSSDGTDIDLDDLCRKVSSKTRAVIAVHLWGRVSDVGQLMEICKPLGIPVIEDACQAHGSSLNGVAAGMQGTMGCFSTKDGKLMWSGEGGFIVTDEEELAERSRAYRNHWLTPPAESAPLSSVGNNYRLSEPIAWIARRNLERFPDLLAQRQWQSQLLGGLLGQIAGLEPYAERSGEVWNGYGALAQVKGARPREFCTEAARCGVPNSVGTFGLVAGNTRNVFQPYNPGPCGAAERAIDSTLAVLLAPGTTEQQLYQYADTLTQVMRNHV